MKNVRMSNTTISPEELPDGNFQIVNTVVLLCEEAKWFTYPDPDPNDPDLPKTGDSIPLLLWGLLGAASCAGIFFLLRKRDTV